MKRSRKFFISFLIAVAVLLVVAKVLSIRVANKGLPQYEGAVTVEGLEQPVEIRRDAYGTPHILAQNENDLYFAVGYVMAQDRLWQMDLLRRVTLGRLSEIFGDDFVDTDLLLRSLEYSAKSKKILETSPGAVKSMASSFSDGVNAYIEENLDNLPLEFTLLGYQPEKWESYQSFNLIGYMAWDLKAGWDQLALEQLKEKLTPELYYEIMPHLDRYKVPVFEKGEYATIMSDNNLLHLDKLNDLGVDVLFGSNNWAVAGSKSTTGMPILANDMHLGFGIPGIWMQMHQEIPGKLNVSGLALPGQPLIIVGHNDSIAWGMTNTYVDNLDYYEEKINPENSDQYEYMGKWYDFQVSEEIIKSKSDSVYNLAYRRSRRGPVVSEIKGVKDRVLTIQWVGDAESNEVLSIYSLNRAGNWNAFKDAFKTFKSISQNVVYADVNGNIGLYACAGVPIRKRNPGFEVLPGWTDEYDWQGMVPFEELPHEFNPDRGYVSSANNKTTDSTYAYHIGTWYSLPYRIERIREMLSAKDKLGVEDFKAMHNDFKSTYAERFISKLLPLIDVEEAGLIYKQAFSHFSDWDGVMDKLEVAPTLFEVTMYKMLENIYKDELGDSLYAVFENNKKLPRYALFNLLETEESPWIDNVNTDEVEDMSQIVTKSFMDAVDYLAENYTKKANAWKWGRIHQITLEHPLSKVEALDKIFSLNRGPFAVGGSFHTVSPYAYPLFETDKVSHGSSHRHIYSLIDWDLTQSVIPTGNSGHIRSPFYMDQTELYIEGKYHDDVFSDKAVEQNTRYELVLKPE